METILTFTAVILINLIAYLTSGKKAKKSQTVAKFRGTEHNRVQFADMYNHRSAGF